MATSGSMETRDRERGRSGVRFFPRLTPGLCAAVVAGSFALSLRAEPAGKRFDPCSLLTASEIGEVQGARVKSARASELERDRFDASRCFYTLEPFSKSINLEVTRRRAGNAEGPGRDWQVFTRGFGKEREGGKRESAGESSPARAVRGLGDEAYWVGPAVVGGLYVLKGDTYFRLSVGGPDSETVKIERLKKLALKVLRRL